MAAKAKAAIEKNGRSLTFSRKSRVPTDSSKPWRSPDATDTSASGPVEYADVVGVVIPEEIEIEKGQMVMTGNVQVLVADLSFPTGHIPIKEIDTITDGTSVWRVLKVISLMPADVQTIYTITAKE